MKLNKLVNTSNLAHDEWLAYRKKGIGGSDAAAVCGLNPYSTAITVFLDKTGTVTPLPDNEAMRQGRDLEEYVAQRFCEETGKKVRRANSIFYNAAHNFMLANVDRLVVGENAGLECKTTSSYNADKWEGDKIPPHYEIQCHHYMAVTGADAWYIACVILGRGFVWHKIERDEDLIQSLIQIEEEFWKENVMKNQMPEPDGSEAAEEMLKQYYSRAEEGKEVELPVLFKEILERKKDIEELLEKLEQEKAEIEQKIKAYMRDAEAASGCGYKISWKNYSSNRVDTKKLKKQYSDAYKNCLKQSTGRKFLIKEEK